MADPVILPSGETFERASLETRRNLAVYPPSTTTLSVDLPSSLLLIPNIALRSAIARWRDAAGDVAGIPVHITCSTELLNENSSPTVSSSTYQSSANSKSQIRCSAELLNENSSPTASSSTSSQSSSSSSITIDVPKPQIPELPLPADPLEDQIVEKLLHGKIREQESAVNLLLEATRESASCRLALGTPRLLAALKDLLNSRRITVKPTVLAAIINLSLETANKVRIVRSGVVPAIIDALDPSSPPAAAENAAGALFSLALEAENRTVIGVLGAIPPLLRLFCAADARLRARLEAGMALHYLGLAEINMTKVARIAGAVKGLIAVTKSDERVLRRVAMRVMVGLVESREGKAAMLDGGAVEASVSLLGKEDNEEGGDEEEEMGVMMLYGMSFVGLRFRGIARRARAEEVLERVVERSEGEKREMAMMTVKAIRGEAQNEVELARSLWAAAAEMEEERSEASEKVAVRRRSIGNSGGGSGPNSAGF